MLKNSVPVNILNNASGAIMENMTFLNLTAWSMELMDIMDKLEAKQSKEEEKESTVEVLDLKDKQKKIKNNFNLVLRKITRSE
eukprot:11160622-Ditylum_brightwellii.AAC.1